MVVVIGLVMLIAPAAAWSTSYSWSGPGYASPFSSPGSFYSPYGMFGSPFGGFSSPFGYGNTFGGSPFSSFGSYGSTPTVTSNSLFDDGMFSDFGDTFGGSVFKKKVYGEPPEEAITDTLVGQKLTYNSGYMGIPLEYLIDESDIGAITGTQYQGEDAWKVRVGQQGVFWDVILDPTGTQILKSSQV